MKFLYQYLNLPISYKYKCFWKRQYEEPPKIAGKREDATLCAYRYVFQCENAEEGGSTRQLRDRDRREEGKQHLLNT